jgi:hypothetical protein
MGPMQLWNKKNKPNFLFVTRQGTRQQNLDFFFPVVKNVHCYKIWMTQNLTIITLMLWNFLSNISLFFMSFLLSLWAIDLFWVN